MATESEWLQQQEPSIKHVTWKSLKVNNQKYLIKTLFTDKSYELAVSNLKYLWYEKVDESGIEKRHEKLNPNVEAPVSKIIEQIKSDVENGGEDVNYNVVFVQDLMSSPWGRKMTLRLKSKLLNMDFEWRFLMRPDNPDYLVDTLTLPLMCMTSELLRRQNELYSRLHEKDREIEALKTLGAKSAKAKQLETTPFEETQFCHEMSRSKDFEAHANAVGESTWCPTGQGLYEECQLKRAWANRPFHPPEEIDEGSKDDGNAEMEEKIDSGDIKSNSTPEEVERREQLAKRLAEENDLKKTVKKPKKLLGL